MVGCGVSPDAWLVAGPPGGGKTTLARPLARHLGAALLDRDHATAPLTRVVAGLVGAQPDDLDDPRMQAALGDAAYEAVLAAAADTLAIGRAVVVVAPFTRALADAAAAREVQRQLGGAALRVVWVDCPPEERHRRLRARATARDARKLATSPLATVVAPGVAHAVVDGRDEASAQLDAALQAPLALGPSAQQ